MFFIHYLLVSGKSASLSVLAQSCASMQGD